MLNISDEYKEKIIQPKRQFHTKIIINDFEIDSRYIKNIKIDEISCSGDLIGIGDVCSNAFEIDMFTPRESIVFENAKVSIKSGLKLDDGSIEWVDLGIYIVNEVMRDKYSIKLIGYDAMKRFEKIYTPGIVFNDNTKFIDVLNDILRQCNISLATQNLEEYEDIIINHCYENISCKELLGYLAGLMGYNARINRNGELEFYWYRDIGMVISDDLVYQGSYQQLLEKEFVINSLTSGNEENTFTCGSGTGISFANPYMTQDLLDRIFLKVNNFSYQPCSFKWRGNPGIENKDIVKYANKNVVMMKQTLVLDGGFSSEVECIGKLKENVVMKTSSPTEIKLNKLYNTLTNAFKQSTETILGQHGGNLIIDLNDDGKPSGWTIMNTPTLESYTKLWKMNQGGLGYSEDGGKTFKNIAFDLNGNFNANIINTGIINGEMFALDLETGVIKIGKRDKDGIISNPSFYLNEQGELTISAFEEIKEELEIQKYLVSIENSGTVLNNLTDSITLNARVYNGNKDETEEISNTSFNWHRISSDTKSDELWDSDHKAKRSIIIDENDLFASANFYCEVILPCGTRTTQSLSIVDNNDIANIGNSFLDITGVVNIQTLDLDDSYNPDWMVNNVVITPVVLDDSLKVDLSKCNIVFKKIVDTLETELSSSEIVTNGILKINKNVMTRDNPAVTYVCYVTYKNTSIKLFASFSLNVIGKNGSDGTIGPSGEDGISIVSVTPYFAVNLNNITPPTSGWVTTQPIRLNGQYLWRKDTIKFSNDTTSTTTPYVVTGDRGDTGPQGNQGIAGKDAAIQSDTEPVDKTQLWYDTVNNIIKRWNGSEWVITNTPFTGETEPQKPYVGMQWGDISITPHILKIWDGENWVSLGNYSDSISGLEGSYQALNTQVNQNHEQIEALVSDTKIDLNGDNVTLKKYVERMKIDVDGITNTLKTTSGNNIIRDSIGCFNDKTWEGSFNLDSSPEIRSKNMYGYAILLKKGVISQSNKVSNGEYVLSFEYKKIVALANVSVVINNVSYNLSNSDFTEFEQKFDVNSGSIEIKFISDTDNVCPVINLMLNKGDEKMEWSLNPNETWSDTVKIGRGVRISSVGTEVEFIAYADAIGFVDKQGNYITTFDDNGLITNEAIIKDKATIVGLLVQRINGQTILNCLKEE